MDKQEVQFAIQTKNGVVERIGRSFMYLPKPRFKGGEVKWYEDKVEPDKADAERVVTA